MLGRLIRKAGFGRVRRPATDFAIPSKQAGSLSESARNHLAKLFYENDGPVVHKWTHYLDAYDQHFSRFRGKPLTMLEIGVDKGGSIGMWRKYFGEEAVIYGIDIDPDCAARVTSPNQVRIGSQNDPSFLQSVVDEMGAPNIVLDDGSHIARHQKKTFEVLFPLLRDGGLYVIEDLHTSYWGGHYEGGYQRKGAGIEQIKQMIDDMHGWYHNRSQKTPARDWIGAIHVYDSIVFIEKTKRGRPGHIKVGAGEDRG